LKGSMTVVFVQSRIFAVDKLVSLAMYGLAASCVAEVLGLHLRSLLAVGGVSGNATPINSLSFLRELHVVSVAIPITLACRS
jgi:hypothetical protein